MIRRFPEELEKRRIFRVTVGTVVDDLTLRQAEDLAKRLKAAGENPTILLKAFSDRELQKILS